MTRRSRARELTLQLLFWRDHNPNTKRVAAERFIRERLRDLSLLPFCLELYDGVVQNLDEIDRRITAVADNWRLHRMATVDRNVLRLGTFELIHPRNDNPAAVILNEAIELARRFGSAESPAFVNGVLDKIAQQRAAESAPAATPAEDVPAATPAEEAAPVSLPADLPANPVPDA